MSTSVSSNVFPEPTEAGYAVDYVLDKVTLPRQQAIVTHLPDKIPLGLDGAPLPDEHE